MGLFDDIVGNPPGEPQDAPGLFTDIMQPDRPAAPVAPPAAPPAGFDERFRGDVASARPAMRAGLERQAEATMGRPSTSEAVLMGAARGNLFEFADEAAAGVNAAIDTVTGQGPYGESYDRHLAAGRQRLRDLETAHPTATLGGQIGGALLSPNLPTTAARSAAAGGFLTGFGSGEGGFTNRLSQGVVGAGTGALIGKGVETVTRSGRALLQFGQNAVQSLVRPNAAAGRKISATMARDLENGTLAMDDQAYAAAQARGAPVAAVDQGGEATRTLARNAADVSPDARAALERNLTQPRFEAQSGRAEQFLQGMFGQNVADTAARRAQLELQAGVANAPMYQRAYRAGDRDIWDPTLENIANTSLGQQALRNAITRSADHDIVNGFAPMNPRVTLDDAQRVVFQRGGMPSYPNIQLWDYTKRELDKMARGANADPLAGQLARRLRDHLDTHVPEYGQARSVARTHFNSENALEAGENFVRGKFENAVSRRAVAQMTPPDRELFAEGFAGRLVNEVREIGLNRNITIDKMFNSPAARERIEIALGPQRAAELETFLRAEHAMQLVHTAVSGNSRTAMLQAGRDAAFVGLGGLAGGSYDGNLDPRDPGAVIGALFAGGIAAGNRRVAAEVGRRLASDDPALMQEAIRTVARSQVLTRNLRQLESRLARAVAQPANEAAVQPATKAALGGIRQASGADPEQEKQR